MAFKLFSDVRETSITGGTGDQVLTGSAFDASYFRFNDRYSNADTFFYCMKQGLSREIGFGTRVTSGDKVSRTQVYKSTNANALVNFTNGQTIDIFVTNIAPDDLDAAGRELLAMSQAPNFSGCGILTRVSGTQLKFAPKNGDKVKINGTWYSIPSGGITAAITGVYVDGVAGQSLTGSSLYLLCLFDNAGTLTFDFRSTLTHAPSTTAGNVGTEIATGLDSRSVIGLARTLPTTANFADSTTQRFVLSWFNRRSKSLQNAFTTARTIATGTLAEINTEIRCEFLTWGDEDVTARITGNANNNTAAGVHVTDVVFDGSGAVDACRIDQPTANQDTAVCASKRAALSEGYHYATLFGRNGGAGGTVTWPAMLQLTSEIRG